MAKAKTQNSLLEAMAELEHKQWAHWTKYMITALKEEGVDLSSSPLIKRWMRQIETPYSELSETEKESDREWARKALQLLRKLEGKK
jgi:MoxR-like ATPase